MSGGGPSPVLPADVPVIVTFAALAAGAVVAEPAGTAAHSQATNILPRRPRAAGGRPGALLAHRMRCRASR